MRTRPEAIAPGATSLDGLIDQGHKVLMGKTRSGKSKLLERFFYRTRRIAFFVNPHRVHLRAVAVSSPRELKQAIASGHRRIQWMPPREHEVRGGRKEVLRLLGEMVAAVFDVGARMLQGDKAPDWFLFIIDEAQLFATKHGYVGPVEMVLTEGAKFGIVGITATQRPARASHEMTGQTAQRFIFKLEPEDEELVRKRMPLDEFRSWTEQPWHFVMVNADKWAPFKPIRLD